MVILVQDPAAKLGLPGDSMPFAIDPLLLVATSVILAILTWLLSAISMGNPE
jgi:hypothetical protein